MIRDKRKEKHRKPVIDLTGPDGNAFVLLGNAQHLAEKLGLDSDAILAEMQAGDYEHLVETFDRHFGEYVDLLR